jgi:hypothetical protein
MEPNNNNNSNNNSSNNNNNLSPPLFPVLNINAQPQYFIQLDSTVKVGECVVFDYNGSSKFGRIIDYDNSDDNDDKNVIINEYSWFRVDLRTYFTKCNEMDRPWKIIIFLTHLFTARKASLTSRVPSFCSNIRANLARIVNETNVTQAYLEW